jgi:cholesterol transport system auxiliary component
MLRTRLLVSVALLLPLSACISFGAKPPKTLLDLPSQAMVAAGAAKTTDDAHSIAVAIPSVQPALATQRLMVQDGPNSVAYLKDTAWAANPGLLFRNLLAETVEAKTGRFVPDQRATGLQPDTRISGQLVDFGLDGPGHAAIVTFDAVVNHSGSGAIRSQRFTARVPVASENGAAVGAAIDQAANQVAAAVAAWVGG